MHLLHFLFQVTGLQQECAIVEVFSPLIVKTRFYLNRLPDQWSKITVILDPNPKTQRFLGNADMMNVFTPLEYSAISLKRTIGTLRKEKKQNVFLTFSVVYISVRLVRHILKQYSGAFYIFHG